ncbi:hypothetical protein [Tumebacillus permanentifrigoris]|uniref:Uncharacterized protein n=1 Tax=Tumebacillus permanentifrigoris TaxID=378543 RepID=A0A316D2C1_9BACL|nr:hypothetical protein [Tumebacillus permanentifrigoris]PWK03952.1 hypothetical protein C7459_1388 [Tumebacillus permanentifrigoris]
MATAPKTYVDGLNRERCTATGKPVAQCRCKEHTKRKEPAKSKDTPNVPVAHAIYYKPKTYPVRRTKDFEIPFGTPIPQIGDEMDVTNAGTGEDMHIRIKQVHSVEWLDDRGVKVDIEYEVLSSDLRVRIADIRIH